MNNVTRFLKSIKAFKCVFAGHKIDPRESIIAMSDKRNWLCECHRCGLYLMHDGAISGMTLLLNEKKAKEIKRKMEQEVTQWRKEHSTMRSD